MVIMAPTGPCVRPRVERLGPGLFTVKATPLLATLETVTTIFPVRAPFGTGTAMLAALQFVGVAVIPLNVTVLVLCVLPKLVPVMVTGVPMFPEVGLTELMLGVGVTVKLTPLLARPFAVTTTLPVVAPEGTAITIVVAFQLTAVPAPVPLNVTVLVPWLAPKFVPVIVTWAPTGPEFGFTLVMVGTRPPVPPAARNATICMIQGCMRSNAAVAL